ncbi:MAG: TRAP transporter small permease [Pseudomonadota bacterium]
MSALDTFNRAIEKIIEYVLLLLLGFFLCLILYQVLSRNLPVLPPIYWTEEFSRFAFQWTVMLGTALGVYHADHFVLDAFKRGSRLDRFTRYVREFVLVGIAIFFIVKGWEYAETGWRRTSTAAKMPMFYVYVTFFVCGVIMLLFKIQRIWMLLTQGLDAMEEALNSAPPEEIALREGDLDPQGPLRRKTPKNTNGEG